MIETPEEVQEKIRKKENARQRLTQIIDLRKQPVGYQDKYDKIYPLLVLEVKGKSIEEIVQKRNTKRSNIANRKKTIEKIITLIEKEQSLEKLDLLVEKLNKKCKELDDLYTEIDVLEDILKEKEQNSITEPEPKEPSCTIEKASKTDKSFGFFTIIYFLLLIIVVLGLIIFSLMK